MPPEKRETMIMKPGRIAFLFRKQTRTRKWRTSPMLRLFVVNSTAYQTDGKIPYQKQPLAEGKLRLGEEPIQRTKSNKSENELRKHAV